MENRFSPKIPRKLFRGGSGGLCDQWVLGNAQVSISHHPYIPPITPVLYNAFGYYLSITFPFLRMPNHSSQLTATIDFKIWTILLSIEHHEIIIFILLQIF